MNLPRSQSPNPDGDGTRESPIIPTGLVGTQTYNHNPRLSACEVFTDPDGTMHYVVRHTNTTTDGWMPGKRVKTWHVTTRSVVCDHSPLVESGLAFKSGLNPIDSETRIHYLQRFDWWQWGDRKISALVLVVVVGLMSIYLGNEIGGPFIVYFLVNIAFWLIAAFVFTYAWITWGHIVLMLTDQRLLLLHNPPLPFIQDQTTDKLLRLISTFDKRSSRIAKTFFKDRYGTIKAGTQEQTEEDGWMHHLPYVRHYVQLQLMVTEIMNSAATSPEGRLLQQIRDDLHPHANGTPSSE